ncbi:MAG: hypothetical protein ACI8S6_004313 [Myxococcota bacterium]|jgi:hypothetical protein
MQAEDAILSLRESLTKGLTGCLTSQDGGSYRVFLMQGDILAAHGSDDGIWIVRRLVNNGAITEGQGRQVIFYLGQGYRLEELLLDQVPDQLFIDLLSERFRQNLLDFAFLGGGIHFEQMDAIFVDNIQVGHDSFTLLDEIAALRDRIAPLRRRLDSAQLRPGATRPRSRREARLLDLCQGLTRLDELLVSSPYEEGPTLDLIGQMLDHGTLDDPQATEPQLAPASEAPTVPPAPPMMTEEHDFDEPLVDYTDSYNDLSYKAPEPPEPELQEPSAQPSAQPSALPESDAYDDPFFSISSDDPPQSIHPLGYNPDDVVEEEVLGLFQDNDYTRGSGGQGQFSVSRDLLDRVDLSTPEVESKVIENSLGEILELGDAESMDDSERASAHSMSFGPPPIEVMEQRRKISICNDVLTELTQALDRTHGPGSGRAFIQLLLDGTPHQYAVLFMGVEIDAAGRVDVDQVIRNLQRRPASERRRMLNLGTIDLINRALSAGSEELSDELLDQLLQRIAGYQMRIGL